jgi:hypothetical protein
MPPVASRSYKDFATRRIVIEKVVERRLGHESPNPPNGWKWDTRYVVEDNLPETLPFPGLKRSHLLGIPRSYWQNGPISGREGNAFKVQEVQEVFTGGRLRWAPIIHNGDLNIWRDSTFFFSDDSVVELLSSSSVDSSGRSTHTLAKTLRSGSPILVTIFRRDREEEYIPWRQYIRREAFSGINDLDGNELTTREGDTIYWGNIDTFKREFISFVRDELVYLIFNQYVAEQITDITTPLVPDDFNDLEYLGTSNGSDNQKYYSDFFPISNDSDLAVYSVNTTAGTWTAYTIVDTFSAANQVQIDYDLGILTFGSSSGPTSPPSSARALYLAYNAVPRIEYEEEGFSDVSVAKDADVSPLGQSLNKGFVTLSRTGLDIASIELATTKPSFSGLAGSYGPVYVGADYGPLLATVYSSSGEVVPDAEVTFYFETSPSFGGLGGSPTSIQRRSGSDGIARTFYVPPASVDSMGYDVTTVSGSSLNVGTDANFSDVQDVYTYYILKDDPLIGIAGADTAIGEVEWNSSNLNGRKVIAYEWSATDINPISGHQGAYVPVRPTSITNGYTLTYGSALTSPDTSSFGSGKETINITSTGLSWTTDTSKSWDTNELNNYVVSSTSLSEYRRIISNTSDTITISGSWSALPTGQLEIWNRAINLGGYWIVSDRYITIRASVYSPKQGRTVYSNLLTLRVSIPDYMKGSYVTDSLQEIPFGWRIIDDQYTEASAISGATFISINPISGPHPIVDVIGGDTWDPYSGPIEIDPWWPYGSYPGEGVSAPFAHFSLLWNIV